MCFQRGWLRAENGTDESAMMGKVTTPPFPAAGENGGDYAEEAARDPPAASGR